MTQLASITIEELREKAREYGQKCAECARNAKSAHLQGRKDDAKLYMSDCKKYEEHKKEADEMAADAVFERNNKYRYLGEIDLHGLYVNEAIEKLEQRIKFIKGSNMRALSIIVGQEHHSEDEPKIKPAVEASARKNNITFHLDSKNHGRICFKFERNGEDCTTTTQPLVDVTIEDSDRLSRPKTQPQRYIIDIPDNHRFYYASKQSNTFWCTVLFALFVLIVGIVAIVKLFFGLF